MPRGKPKPKQASAAAAEMIVLEEYGLTTEEAVAALLGVEVKTLKNRPVNELPPFTKSGGKRRFFKDDVMAFLKQNRSRAP